MKKAILFLLLLNITMTLPAAVVKWSAMMIRENGSALANATAVTYFVEAGTDMTKTWEAITTGADPMSLFGYTSSAVTNERGNISEQVVADFNNHGGFEPNTAYDAYLVIFDSDERQFFYTDAKSLTTPPWKDDPLQPPETDAALQFGIVNITEEDWIAIVPEPTALALLALGVAGLALRRRCA